MKKWIIIGLSFFVFVNANCQNLNTGIYEEPELVKIEYKPFLGQKLKYKNESSSFLYTKLSDYFDNLLSQYDGSKISLNEYKKNNFKGKVISWTGASIVIMGLVATPFLILSPLLWNQNMYKTLGIVGMTTIGCGIGLVILGDIYIQFSFLEMENAVINFNKEMIGEI